MFNRMLVPVDGSPASRKAAKQAIAFAKAINASMTFYYAIPPASPVLFGEGYVVPQKAVEEIEAAQRATGEKYVGEAMKKAEKAGVKCDSLVTRAVPGDGVLAAASARKCDVIVIGSHGWGALKRFVLGSVTQRVLAHAKVPVLVYR
jgi:nucleotide-binding universal stress UspA family protein